MKKIVVNKDTSLRFFLESDGFYKNPINVNFNKKDSFLIKNNPVSLNLLNNSGDIVKYSFWELVKPINGRKYISVNDPRIDVVSVTDIIGNKIKIQPLAFDGIELSNTENLDSGFDGFFN
jgi:hypothetical protein